MWLVLPGCLLLSPRPPRPGDSVDDVLDTRSAVEIAVGHDAMCAADADQAVTCSWSGYTVDTTPPEVALHSVAANHHHFTGLDADGEVWTWAVPTNGDHGQADAPDGPFSEIVAGLGFSCALKAGSIACWGDDAYGATDAPDGTFATLAAGRDGACAIRADGRLACWGDTPTPPDGAYTDLAVGYDTACAVGSDGALACWGEPVDPPAGRFVSVQGTYFHWCALDADGEATCWGQDTWGETVAPEGPFEAVSAGYYVSCGVRPTGSVACWGDLWAE